MQPGSLRGSRSPEPKHPIRQLRGAIHCFTPFAMIRSFNLRMFYMHIPRCLLSLYHFSNPSGVPPILAACHPPNRQACKLLPVVLSAATGKPARRGGGESIRTLLAKDAAHGARCLGNTQRADHASRGLRMSKSKLRAEHAARGQRSARSTQLAKAATRGARNSSSKLLAERAAR